jgi:hypothetical protein
LCFWLGICNQSPLSILTISPKVYIEVIPFWLRLPIPWGWWLYIPQSKI